MQKLKVGDMVQVMRGGERTRATNRGKVMSIDRSALRVRVEGLRLVKRHLRKGVDRNHQDGGIVEKSGSIALANLAVVCPKCSKATRVGIREGEAGKTVKRGRFCKKCNASID